MQVGTPAMGMKGSYNMSGAINFELDDRFSLAYDVSCHTLSLTKHTLTYSFQNVYYLVLWHLKKLQIPEIREFVNRFPDCYLDSNKPNEPKSYGYSYPRVRLDRGFAIKMSFHRELMNPHEKDLSWTNAKFTEMNFITLIINPDVAISCIDDDSSETYDYTRIAEKDFQYWKIFDRIYIDFLYRWELHDEFYKLSTFRRLDFSVTINVGENFDKILFLKYISKLPRRRSYSEVDFKYSGQNDHQSKAENKTQALTFYDKNYEQKVKFDCDVDRNLLRLEYQVSGTKFKDICNKLQRKGYISVPNAGIFAKLYIASNISFYVIAEALDRIYPDGDLFTLKRAKRRIMKLNNHESTKRAMIYILESFVESKSYDDTKAIEARLKHEIGKARYARLIKELGNAGICPMCITYRDRIFATRLPGPKSIFLSAFINSIDNVYIDRDTAFVRFNETDMLNMLSDI